MHITVPLTLLVSPGGQALPLTELDVHVIAVQCPYCLIYRHVNGQNNA